MGAADTLAGMHFPRISPILSRFVLLAWALALGGFLAPAPANAQQYQPPNQDNDSFADAASTHDDLGAPKRKHPGWLFHRAKKDTPEAQYAYAEKQLAKGNVRKAAKAFNALVHRWHDAPEAARAQRMFADLLVRRGKAEQAFEEYQYLMRYFAGTFPYQDTLETQFKLANAVRTERHADILFLPGFEDPGRAVPLYEQLVSNGPNWERAPEAQFNVGAIQEATGEPELAVVSYETLLLRYSRSDLAMEAAYRRAHTLYTLSKKSARDEDQCREALSALLGFMRNHPEDSHAEEAKTLAEELKQRLADMYFDRAIFYDKIAKKPKSAIIAYSDFANKFPTSDRRVIADERVAALQLQVERTHEN